MEFLGYLYPYIDLCDRLARGIPEMGIPLEERAALELDVTTIKRSIKQWATNFHCATWMKLQGCRQLMMFVREPYQVNLIGIVSLSREKLQLLVQVLTGHNLLNSHSHRMGLFTSPDCVCVRARETGLHL